MSIIPPTLKKKVCFCQGRIQLSCVLHSLHTSQPHRIKFRIRIKCSASDIQNVIDAFIESAMTSNEKDHRAADDDADMADNNRGDDDLAASLPDEILDYVLSLVSAYGDVRRCSLVCKRWHKAVARVAAKTREELAEFVKIVARFFDILPDYILVDTLTVRSKCSIKNIRGA